MKDNFITETFCLGDMAMHYNPSKQGEPITVRGREYTHILGEGGMAVVYDGGDHALKVRRMDLDSNDIADFNERLLLEGEIGKRITHSHVIRTYGVVPFEHEGTPNTAVYMDKYGSNLVHALNNDKPLSVVLKALRDTAKALQYFAQDNVGLIHRDIKWDNTIYDGKKWRVGDLGMMVPLPGSPLRAFLQKGLDFKLQEELHSMQVLGTPHYMAPESVREESITPSFDIYSLSTLLYELVTGQSYNERIAGVNENLDAIVLALNEYSPAQHRKVMATFQAQMNEELGYNVRFLFGTEYLPFERLVSAGLHPDPTRRPSPTNIVKVLDRLIERVQPSHREAETTEPAASYPTDFFEVEALLVQPPRHEFLPPA